MSNYDEIISQLNDPSFDKIRNIAISDLPYLTKREDERLWTDLNHGTELLNTPVLMCKYLQAYGKMHQAKIKKAVEKIPLETYSADFDIIDWGCG